MKIGLTVLTLISKEKFKFNEEKDINMNNLYWPEDKVGTVNIYLEILLMKIGLDWEIGINWTFNHFKEIKPEVYWEVLKSIK